MYSVLDQRAQRGTANLVAASLSEVSPQEAGFQGSSQGCGVGAPSLLVHFFPLIILKGFIFILKSGKFLSLGWSDIFDPNALEVHVLMTSADQVKPVACWVDEDQPDTAIYKESRA